MSLRRSLLGAAIAAGLLASPVAAETSFNLAFQGFFKSLDPYSLNESFTLSMLSNVYKGLIRHGPDLVILPGLATSWEVVEPTRWRFNQRKGVKFHNGNELTADDVIFSADRVRAEGSGLKKRIPADAKFVRFDEQTIDVVLSSPKPALRFEWQTRSIIAKEWAEANDSVRDASEFDRSATPISLRANGTGAYMIESHEVGLKTVMKANTNWWDAANKPGNADVVEFSTICSDATRVATLLSGEMELVYPVPVKDIKRVDATAATKAPIGRELRTSFSGFDERRNELI